MVLTYVSIFLCVLSSLCWTEESRRQLILNKLGKNQHIGPFDYSQTQPLKPYLGQDDSTKGAYNYSQYQPYAKIVKELRRITRTPDEHVQRTMFSIGRTFENRTLWGIKFQYKDDKKKKIIFIDCGAHAREWIAPSTCMYLINELSPPSKLLLPVLKKFDWIILPLLNPDGYVYSWRNNITRMWRKNRSYNKEQLQRFNETNNPLCIGVDINRNFAKDWGGAGAPVNDPCYEMYAGSKPFSENESSALADYLRMLKNDTVAYVTLHCYGQHWMTPWGFTTKRPGEYKEMKRVAELAVKAMKEFSGVIYTVGPSHDELYPNSGSSTDWAYSNLPTPYTYIVEMLPAEDTEASFKVPPAMMVKNAKDILHGLLEMATKLKEEKVDE